MIRKRLLSLLLIGTMLMPMTVHATPTEDNEVIQEIGMEEMTPVLPTALDSNTYESLEAIDVIPEDGVQTQEVLTQAERWKEVESRIKNALLTGQTKVSIEDLSISIDEYRPALIYYSPYMVNVDGLSFFYYKSTRKYAYVMIDSQQTLEEINEIFAKIDSEINKMDGLITPSMTEFEKALVLHDYIATQYEYAYKRLNANSLLAADYRSGGLLLNETGVCQAYAYLYMYFLHRFGIECYVTSSDSMNHAWNIVNIDGNYYHVDVTWDDPVLDKFGFVDHKYFLFTDTEDPNHVGWDRTDLICSSTAYLSAFWKNVNSPVIVKEDAYYYVKLDTSYNALLIKRDKATNQETTMVNLGRWYTVESANSFWTISNAAIACDGNTLYYHTQNRINKISLDGSGSETLYELTAAEYNQSRIYGLRIKGNYLEFALKAKPHDATSDVRKIQIKYEIPITNITLSETAVTLNQNETKTLTATVYPENTTDAKTISWSSSNTAVATVSSTGVVTAKAPGSATITATTVNGKKAACTVTVKLPISWVSLNKTTLEIEQGATATLTATVYPENTTDAKTISWSSSNTAVATVTSAGVVTAKAPGSATITATTVNGKKAACTVTVNKKETVEPEIPDISFIDVTKSDWYYRYVQYVAKKGIMKGKSSAVFAPLDKLSRAEFAVILHRVNGSPKAEYRPAFFDVPDGTWYTDAILWGNQIGVINGYSNGCFGPLDNISREQMALMMYRYAKQKNYDTSIKKDLRTFADSHQVSSYAKEAMSWAVGMKIITGKNNGTQLDPLGNTTRAECATIITRFCETYE